MKAIFAVGVTSIQRRPTRREIGRVKGRGREEDENSELSNLWTSSAAK